MKLWVRELGLRGDLDLTPEIVFFKDAVELVRLVKGKQVDMFNLGSLEYLQHAGRIPVRPELVAVAGDDVYDTYILLAHRARNATQVSHLAGSRLVVPTTGVDASLPFFWLESLLTGDGLGPSPDFFSEVRRVDKTSQAVISVFFGQADACLVSKRLYDTTADLNPQLRSDLVVLVESPGYLPAVACFRADFPSKLTALVKESALTLHTQARGRQILTLFGVRRIRPFEPDMLATTMNLVERLVGSGNRISAEGTADLNPTQ